MTLDRKCKKNFFSQKTTIFNDFITEHIHLLKSNNDSDYIIIHLCTHLFICLFLDTF